MVELQPNRVPASSEIATALKDCSVRKADYRKDKAFSGIKRSLRLNLWDQQIGLCVYCESALPDKSQIAQQTALPDDKRTRIEHIKPQSVAPESAFDFDNLALSCGSKHTCDRKKSDKILPLEPAPKVNCRFRLNDDGRLYPASPKNTQLYKEESEAIAFLGLNAPHLIDERSRTLREIIARIDVESQDSELKDELQGMPFGWTLTEYFRL